MSEFTGLITTEFKQIHTDMITELIRGCAVNCRLYYSGSKITQCPNCIVNIQLGKSSNRYKVGGPIPFTTGICPYCRGDGKIAIEETEDISLVVLWEPKSWIVKIIVNSPDEYIQTIGMWSTAYTKIKQAKEIVADTSIEDDTLNRFVRHGEPKPCGLGGSNFVVTMWKRAS
jgi:hypothetical protein